MDYNYIMYFTIKGNPNPCSACVKARNPDDGLYALSSALSEHGANDIRLITMTSVSDDYIFENQSLIQMWV